MLKSPIRISELCSRLSLLVLLGNLSACYALQPPREPESNTPTEIHSASPLPLEVSAPNPDMVQQQLQALQKVHYPAYRIQPGDVFDIFLYGEDSMHLPEAKVRLDGYLSYYLTGETKVAGLTLSEATEHLKIKLLNYFEDPNLSLIPKQIHSPQFTILGQVHNPGRYTIDAPLRLVEALAEANGIKQEVLTNLQISNVDLKRSYLIRDQHLLPINFEALLKRGDMLQNIPILPGDHIYIAPALDTEIYVLGEVKSPSVYPYQAGMQLSQALARAGGFLSLAELQHVYVIRGSLQKPQVYQLDLTQILAGSRSDFVLDPGDIVYLPPNGLSRWKDISDSLLPSLQSLQSAFFIYDITRRNLP